MLIKNVNMEKTPSENVSKAYKKAGGNRGRKRTESYSSYIYKVLKKVLPDIWIRNKVMSIMNYFIN